MDNQAGAIHPEKIDLLQLNVMQLMELREAVAARLSVMSGGAPAIFEHAPSFAYDEAQPSFFYGDARPSYLYDESRPSFGYGSQMQSFAYGDPKASMGYADASSSFYYGDPARGYVYGQPSPSASYYGANPISFASTREGREVISMFAQRWESFTSTVNLGLRRMTVAMLASATIIAAAGFTRSGTGAWLSIVAVLFAALFGLWFVIEMLRTSRHQEF
jgi:hypothetical protein